MDTPIYCLSGLGADHRVFEKLENDFNLVHIPWLEPTKNESLSFYARRLIESIYFPEKFYLLGLSFGGVVAQELATILKPTNLILVSTFSPENPVSYFHKIPVLMGLNRLFLPQVFSKFGSINAFFFGVNSFNDKRLLKTIISDTSRQFFIWATRILSNFRNSELPLNTLFIHGNKDRIIPFKRFMKIHEVNGAGHFITLTHFSEIKRILNEHLT